MPLGFGGLNTSITYQGWTPSVLQGIQDWWRADLGVKTSSGALTSWQSQAGYRTNMTQVSGVITPTKSSLYNNQIVMAFAASAFVQKTAYLGVSTQPWTILVVGNLSNITTSNYPLSNGSAQIGYYSTFAGKWYAYTGDNLNGGTADTNPHAFILICNAAASVFNVDNSAVMIGTATSAGTNALGNDPYWGDSSSFTGNIAEMTLVARALLLAERQEFMRYAAARYGLNAS
jgi:hypothetical protein